MRRPSRVVPVVLAVLASSCWLGAQPHVAFAAPPDIVLIPFDAAAPVVEAGPSLAHLRPRIGLELHTPKTQTIEETADQIGLARELGFGFVRTDLFWARVETTRGRYDFSAFDGFLDTARKNGLGVLWTLAFGNTLYGTPGYGNTQPGNADSAAFRAQIDAYASYAAAAAKHFAGAKDVRFEIWNEPDRNAALRDPGLYGETFRKTLAAMRAADPDVRVSTGGVSNFQAPLLQAVATSADSKGATAIGVHPYRSHRPPETVDADVPALHRTLLASDHPGTHIWDTEWGYSAYGDFPASFGDGHSDDARRRQAVYDVRELLAVWKLDLPLAVLYELKDGGTDPTNREHNFGLIDAANVRKPAFDAVARLSKVADGRHYAGHYARLPAGLHAIRLDDDQDRGYTIVLWLDRPDATAAIAVTGGRVESVTDLWGRTLSTSQPNRVSVSEGGGPVYLSIAPNAR